MNMPLSAKSIVWFTRSLGKPKTLNVVLEFCRLCNLQCDYCPRPNMPIPKQISMEKKTLLQIIEFIKQLNVAQTSFTIQGLGEPLLCNNLLPYLKLLRSNFSFSPINVTSNGTILNSGLIEKVDNLLVSLNFSNAESYLLHSKNDYYDLVVDKIKGFLKTKGNLGPSTCIQLLNLPENDWVQFQKEWLPILNKNDTLTLHSMNEWNTSKQKLPNRHPCSRLWNQIYFTTEGDIYPCCLGEVAEDLKLGNVNSNFNYAKLEHLKQAHKLGSYEIIQSCNKCHVWNETSCPFLKVGTKWL